jgi:histidyl-tRNA synthetase
MATAQTQPARGMRDFLPGDVRRREYVIGIVADVYRRYGFEPLETPAVENIETLMGKYGEEGDRLIFRILKRGEEGRQTSEADLALRYDLTVPLARVVAQYTGQLPRIFKRYQVQPVWRADRPQKGRFREFYQCDVDVVGSRSMVVEAELCAAASDVLHALGFEEFALHLNHRQLLTGMLNGAGVPEPLHAAALVALDKHDKVGWEGVLGELKVRGIEDTAASTLSRWLGAASQPDWLDWLEREFGDRVELIAASLAELREILRLSQHTSAARRLRLDPSLARGLSYYTGAIMEIRVTDLAGSLGGGGRYDGLVGMFLGEQVPACGFSLGLERILVVMTERSMFPAGLTTAPADVLITLWNAERAPDALALAASLRANGVRVDVYPDTDKIGKQLKYASTRNIPFVVVAGDDEVQRGEVTVKDMRTGEQRSIGREEVATLLGRA